MKHKSSVRFYPPHKPTTSAQLTCDLRATISCNGKRFPFYVTIQPDEISYMFTAISSNGGLRRDWQKAVELCEYKEHSLLNFNNRLCMIADVMEYAMQMVVEGGMFEQFTGADAQFFADRAIQDNSHEININLFPMTFESWLKLKKKGEKRG